MSKSIQALREHRVVLAKEIRNLAEQNPGATWNDEHQKVYDTNMEEIRRIEGEIDRLQSIHDLALDRELDGHHAARSRIPEAGEMAERGLFNAWARGSLTSEQAVAIRNTMSTTTGSEGGFTVQTDVAKTVQDALKLYGGVRLVADVITTEGGNSLQFPTSDGTLEEGEQVAQNTSAGSVNLDVYKYISKVVAVPFELLQDSSVDIEAFVANRLAQRLARIQNRMFTLGTGTAQPRGVVTAAAAGKVGTTGQTTTILYEDLVDLQHAVDPAYRQLGCEWMFNDNTLKAIRKIKDTQGRPIFVPGYEVGSPGGAPDTLLGTPININQHMADMAASAKSVLYGYFKAYKVRDVMEFQLFRFTDSAYTRLGQVGFLAWARTGGNYIDVGKSLAYYQNSAT